MNVALCRPIPVTPFLEWEGGQEFRHEFDGSAPVAMDRAAVTVVARTGASWATEVLSVTLTELYAGVEIAAP